MITIENESFPEVRGVADRSGVYKMPMVRMCKTNTDENPNVRVYKAEHIEMYVKLRFGIWGKVKLSSYEIPYTVTGGIKYAGSEDYLRASCKDRNIGTRKGQNAESCLL